MTALKTKRTRRFCRYRNKNTEAGRKSGDPFWDRAELNLLKALVLYVKDKDGYVPVEKQNMAKVYDLLASKDPAMIAKLFENLPDDKAAKMAYNLYSQVNEKSNQVL